MWYILIKDNILSSRTFFKTENSTVQLKFHFKKTVLSWLHLSGVFHRATISLVLTYLAVRTISNLNLFRWPCHEGETSGETVYIFLVCSCRFKSLGRIINVNFCPSKPLLDVCLFSVHFVRKLSYSWANFLKIVLLSVFRMAEPFVWMT